MIEDHFQLLNKSSIIFQDWGCVHQQGCSRTHLPGESSAAICTASRCAQSRLLASLSAGCTFCDGGSSEKTAQTVLLVVAAFLFCWMPHHIIAMWVEFGVFPLSDASFAFRITSHCLAYGNSCVNPILYAFLSENFRKACRQAFACRLFYSPPPVKKIARIRMENFSTTPSTTNV
ncbi:hypothetical protein P4O66_021801 [Electrophorus voltai]|uniref:G-protein coupled receptors family 1 profile domain-containing protein n=1 Tax=Electrophorus voltai TaxID=2609070 RepID=A0AAD8ZPI7_9TELE|nr:hypothetical protein P4O66_021801 [Electrophorus voltai]